MIIGKFGGNRQTGVSIYLDVLFASLCSLVFLLTCLMFLVLMLEFSLTRVDEFMDELLTTDYSCDIALPRVQKR